VSNATLAALDREWQSLAHSPDAKRRLMRWGRAEPRLAGLDNLEQLLELRRDPAAAPAVLATLARFAPSDVLAGRTLLQALIPGLISWARSAGYDDPAAIDEMVSLAYERIRTYPQTRRGSVAANVLLDVRKAYRRHRCIEKPHATTGGNLALHARSAEDQALGRHLIGELADARRRGVISAGALELIVRTRLADVPLEAIAHEERVNVQCLVARRSRAERRLRACLEPVA
jgi:hypothetical protein